jgi:hypothetical protein
MNRIVGIVLGVLLVVVIAGGSFYGGMVYGKNQAEQEFPAAEGFEGMPGAAGRRGQFGGQFGTEPGTNAGQLERTQGGSLFGEIQSIGDGEMTIVDQSGDQVTIYVTDTTLIQKQAEVTLADLAEGETVVISGSRGDDGSVTARMLQVSPEGGFFGRPVGDGTDGQ